MKTYRWLFIIIIIALASIISLQAYFSYNDFKLKVDSFNQNVNSHFLIAAEKEKQSKIDDYMNYFTDIFLDTSKTKLTYIVDSVTHLPTFYIWDAKANSHHTSIAYTEDSPFTEDFDGDTLGYFIEQMIETEREYTEEKANFYWTDSLAIYKPRYLNQVLLDTSNIKAYLNEQLKSDNISPNYQLEYLDMDTSVIQEKSNGKIYSESFLLSLMETEPSVRAIFENPFMDIFWRSAITWGGSILVIMLTVSCFVILMRIIIQQKKLVDIKDDFIDNITHELQTPLATLMAANESLQRYNTLADPEKTQRYLKVSERELKHMSKMVDNIVLNSIYVQQEHYLPKEKIDMEEMLKDVKHKFALTAEKNIFINVHNTVEYGQLITNSLHLKNILDNLVENAIKYNDKSNIKISLKAYAENDWIKIDVKDNGIGIETIHHEKIFNKFYRVKQEKTSIKGYGIGLFYIKNILEQLKGNISLSSIPKEGSTFTISLPQSNDE